MPFDFRYTCPEIDSQLDEMEDLVRTTVRNEDIALSLIEKLSFKFEYLRELIQEMRSEAEDLIADLERQLHWLELQIQHFENHT